MPEAQSSTLSQAAEGVHADITNMPAAQALQLAPLTPLKLNPHIVVTVPPETGYSNRGCCHLQPYWISADSLMLSIPSF